MAPVTQSQLYAVLLTGIAGFWWYQSGAGLLSWQALSTLFVGGVALWELNQGERRHQRERAQRQLKVATTHYQEMGISPKRARRMAKEDAEGVWTLRDDKED